MFNLLPFQLETKEELLSTFVKLWKKTEYQLPLVFKSPTGSGKTLTIAHFIQGLNHLPNWDYDKAFIWITFSDDLAMQSKHKFEEYFDNNLENGLLTVNDINKGKLIKNEILFLNWQKVVSRSAETRILRRPENEDDRKETGQYFEDFIDNTHKDNREIVLVIDEAHKNKSTELAQDIIDYINPKIIVHVTATPKDDDELLARRHNSFIEVDRKRVIDEGLIKEKIMLQTEEDLKTHKKEDLDEVLLTLGIKKREQLKKEFESLGKKINPLMLIQLPNDDKELRDRGEKTKEEVVLTYLASKGVDKNKIALWFDNHKENLDYITDNQSDIDFMLFKQAAGTGWDCPRAHVLVMFREINSPIFYLQTLGRILRMPEPQKKEDYKNNPNLRLGYLYTNYHREDVNKEWDKSDLNKPLIYWTRKKQGITEINLQSDYVPRSEYGDLANSAKFQESFIKSMNKYFGITDRDIIGGAEKKMVNKGFKFNIHLINKIIVNAQFKDFDDINYEFQKEGKDLDKELSNNDIEKTFNYSCFSLLKEQTEDEAKISNIARSWSPLKSALRVWFKNTLSKDSSYYYRLFINDIYRGSGSVMRPAITRAIKDYKPILQELIEEKRKQNEERLGSIFTIKDDEYGYTEDYEEVKTNLFALDKCYFLRDYLGKKNEANFKNYIDNKDKQIEWWFKNADVGKEYYSIRYYSNVDKAYRLFYPDWIIRFKDGKTGIFDTKKGDTASSQDTKDKAKALSQKLKQLGQKYLGGIAIFENGIWYYNDSEKYKYVPGRLDEDWKKIEEVLKRDRGE